jgi:hypothetical protein
MKNLPGASNTTLMILLKIMASIYMKLETNQRSKTKQKKARKQSNKKASHSAKLQFYSLQRTRIVTKEKKQSWVSKLQLIS